MVELVTVIVLVGILAAVALPRLVGVATFREQTSGDRVVSGLRYAQQQAMSRNRFVEWAGSGRTFAIRYCTDEVSDPDDCGNWDSLPSPATGEDDWPLENGSFANATTLYFDALGRSVQKTNGDVLVEKEVSLSDGGATVTVNGETGFAYRQ